MRIKLLVTNQRYAIADVVPHSGRMVLIDELLDYGLDYAVAAVNIRPDSVLSDGRTGVPAWVGLEYMAQTIGAFTGVEDLRCGRRPSVYCWGAGPTKLWCQYLH
jgi:predicted hotdog family 3-hydroxylacyl-ACP dehydratase